MKKVENRSLGWLVVGIGLLAAGLAALAAEDAEPGLAIAQPEYLTVQAENAITFCVHSPVGQRLPKDFELVSEDGLVSVPVCQTSLGLGPGPNRCILTIGPGQLAPFAIGEIVTLRGQVGPWQDEVDITLVASPRPPESSGWILNGPATAMLYSTQDSHIAYRIINPKTKIISAKLKLKFRNRKGIVVATWKYPTLAAPGQSNTTAVVPVAIGVAAKTKGAVSVKTVLMSAGLVKSKTTSLLDWDLTATATADKVSGPAPLTITFIGSASGGTPLYQYQWDFGDGAPGSTEQTPSHTYARPGIYQAVLSVSDARGGSAAAAPILITVQ